MKYTLILLSAMMAGCSTTVPVKPKFPDIPSRLLEKCPQLQLLDPEPKLSDVSKTVAINYSTYYECAVKHDGLVEWYKVQKILYEK